MTDEERDALQNRLRASDKPLFDFRSAGGWQKFELGFGLFFFMGAFAGGVLFVLLLFLLHFFPTIIPTIEALPNFRLRTIGLALVLGSAFVSVVAWFLWARLAHQKRRKMKTENLSKEVAEGKVEVLQVKAHKAARCKPFEYLGKEPKAFFVDIGPGQLLYLQGNYLRKTKPGDFPNTDFLLVRGIYTGEIYSIHCQGKPFKLTTLDVANIFDEECYVPRDGEVIEGSIETLEKDLRKLHARH